MTVGAVDMNASKSEAIDADVTEPGFGDFFALLKPRVMSLVVFTALVGILAAPSDLHGIEVFAAILFIAIGGGASGALNMWWDADIDAVMRRTKNRPVPKGLITPDAAKVLGLALAGMSVVMLGLAANWHAAAWLAFTIFFYAVVYTMWLKRLTPQNIVIGGAAGAFPPLIGWVAATGSLSIEAWLMFAIIFMWTPPHFWALALFVKTDYKDAGVPMLTVTHGPEATRRHILVYSVFLAAMALGAAFTSLAGPVYLVTAVVLNVVLMIGAVMIWRRSQTQAEADNFAIERKFFTFSLAYLFLHFLAILIDSTVWGYIA